LDGDQVIVEIEDNGSGTPSEVQSKIFDPFFTTKPPGQGSGLGLDISYNIVARKHQGEIKVFSKPGQTCFQVWLPLNLEVR
jgi:signal transduction histidine kinase